MIVAWHGEQETKIKLTVVFGDQTLPFGDQNFKVSSQLAPLGKS